ncbi:MAG: DUF5668 domain-containing protein [Melioribacteraceae bacterium]|nr:DUF5668 domain-containing protein [Melioribacteraceae bacterium]
MKHSNGRFFVGLLLILIGTAFIIKNLDLVPWHIEYYYISWPTYILLIGLVITIASRGGFFGPAVILAGGIFIYGRVYDYPAGEIFETIWPIFLILFGLSIIFERGRGKKKHNSKDGWIEYPDETIDLTTIFSENKRKIISQNFVGAKLFTMFGATELDLTSAKLDRSCTINCDTLFGGTEIFLPADWKVINRTTSIFGGSEDTRRKSAPVEQSQEHVLTIDGFCMFGGIEIK